MNFCDDIDCPLCKEQFRVDMREGDRGSCPKCGNKFVIDSLGDKR
jgi:uncharacterized Zn-finger protein